MATRSMIAQIRVGMRVTSADGKALGKITQVWFGAPTSCLPWEGEVCLVGDRGDWGRARALYLPCHAVADVVGEQVNLNVDAALADAMPWNQPPAHPPAGGSPRP